MEKINYPKVILITLSKMLLVISIFFSINNWVNIKQSFNGTIPKLNIWLDHAFTLSNLIAICLLSVVFFMNTLKKQKELMEIRSKYTEV